VVSLTWFAEGTLARTPTPIVFFEESRASCPERDRIAEQFDKAFKAYSDAVNGLRTLHGYQFNQHQNLVETARTACEAVRESLRDHENEHGCTRADPRGMGLSVHDPSSTVILLAEDDLIIRNLVRVMLTKQGYAVLTAADGVEAMEVCTVFRPDTHAHHQCDHAAHGWVDVGNEGS
jgi:hypothetical protein